MAFEVVIRDFGTRKRQDQASAATHPEPVGLHSSMGERQRSCILDPTCMGSMLGADLPGRLPGQDTSQRGACPPGWRSGWSGQ